MSSSKIRSLTERQKRLLAAAQEVKRRMKAQVTDPTLIIDYRSVAIQHDVAPSIIHRAVKGKVSASHILELSEGYDRKERLSYQEEQIIVESFLCDQNNATPPETSSMIDLVQTLVEDFDETKKKELDSKKKARKRLDQVILEEMQKYFFKEKDPIGSLQVL